MSSTKNSPVEIVDQIATYAAANGIAHLYSEDESLSSNLITLRGKVAVNFGSCSYLGLEFDERLKKASVDAVQRYGTQFSESRAYVSVNLYNELEALLTSLFGYPTLVVPTTTLGHIGAIPVLVQQDDAVIVDHQVHTSVQTAVQLVKARGTHVELIRHNRVDLLEQRIIELSKTYKHIWYMADGIYSMYGDACPIKEINDLLNRYKQFRFYVDDAHGMSCFGENGKGYVLNGFQLHERAVMATSFAKAFATGGAALVFPNSEMARKVRACATTLITSGPMQPSCLGAAVASAKIHLSGEIKELQDDLRSKILFANLMLKKYQLPLISASEAAIFFVGVSLPKLGYNLVKRMLNRGYYVNLGIFPAVPMRNTGIRFTITRLHSFAQIESMISTLANEFPKALAEEEMTMEQIYRAFKMPVPEEMREELVVNTLINQSLELSLEHRETVFDVNMQEWNSLFEGKGNFDWHGCAFLENTFTNNELPENNWKFDYIFIRDNSGKIVAATFLTTSLWKDDMLSPAGVSELVEEKRKNDPYYLTSTVITTGSQLTEGEHVYIDKSSPLWKDAMRMLFQKMHELQDQYQANSIVVRDFMNTDESFDSFFVDNGFFKYTLPDANIIPSLSWEGDEGFYESLSKRSKKHFREDGRKHIDKYILRIEKEAGSADIQQWYRLYLNVKQKNLGLNTFALPYRLFENMLSNHNWQIMTLHLKGEYNYKEVEGPLAVMFCYQSGEAFVPVLLGMDYTYQQEYKTYLQVLYHTVMQAKKYQCKTLSLGFSATTEKKKVGAQPVPVVAYMQMKDSYNMQVIGEMQAAAVKMKP
jgi:7-keto-8-aminopelargonate synthetase-like enzyme